jgi:hypothetical protein
MKFLLLLFIFACSNVHVLKTQDHKRTYNPTNPKDIDIIGSIKAKKAYRSIGLISVSHDSDSNIEVVSEMLKEEAAKLGADAVVDVRYQTIMGYWSGGVNASGVAVKYRKLEI